mmetsp:Transcript_14391/g.56794  ORF Transcript_14391/g.56794 Transcript_14391/m.56794 type:complete len:114 (-) Transcript_14391:245-586(-)
MSQALALNKVVAAPKVARRTIRRAKVVASANPVAKVAKKETVAPVALTAGAAGLFAAMPAQAQDAMFQLAELGDDVDEETALYVLVGGSLVIATAVLSLVIGSDLFIKNIVNK